MRKFNICVSAGMNADTTIIIECKRSRKLAELIKDAEKCAQQIIDKKYDQDFSLDES